MLQLETLPTLFDLHEGDAALFTHAHPDDAELTAAAMERLEENGVTVYTHTANDGEASTLGDPAIVRSGGRRQENIAALAIHGIPEEQQYYAGLRDGELQKPDEAEHLRNSIGFVLQKHPNIRAIVSPGEHGIDGHPDHKAVHQAARFHAGIRYMLSQLIEDVPEIRLYGLDNQTGNIYVPVHNRERKLLAQAQHRTQYTIDVVPGHVPRNHLEAPDIRMADDTFRLLEGYTQLLVWYEVYRQYTFVRSSLDTEPADLVSGRL